MKVKGRRTGAIVNQKNKFLLVIRKAPNKITSMGLKRGHIHSHNSEHPKANHEKKITISKDMTAKVILKAWLI
jgi:hypothetical protein